MQIFSNAFNFSSYLNGGVDLRTGQYGNTLTLASISPESGVDVERNITLSFSTMASQTVAGYGLGWSLSNTRFYPQTQQLQLLGGESYLTSQLPPSGPNAVLQMRDKKLQDVVVKRPNDSTLHVIYKEGVVEVLRVPRQGDPYHISQILFESGESYLFGYTATGLLSSIMNEQSRRIILSLQYNNGLLSTADALKDGGRVARTYFRHSNGQLFQISVPVDSANPPGNSADLPQFTYIYQSFANGLRGISNFKNPMGGEEIISYQENGHAFADNTYLPFVTRVSSRGGSTAPESVSRFSYSGSSNFTGYPISNFQPGEDNLYKRVDNYVYWGSEEKLDQNIVVQTRKLTFNRFHLQINEQTTRPNVLLDKSYVYNEIPGAMFASQPANLRLPKQIVTRYQSSGAYRDETETIDTDAYGNELSRLAPSGIRHTFSYYPIAGMPGYCPAEPHQLFVRYLKEERVTPTGGEMPKVSTFTHAQINNFARNGYYVMQASHTYDTQSERITYIENHDQIAMHGRQSEVVVTVNKHETRIKFSYQLSDDVLFTTRTVVGFDHISLSTRQSSSIVNGLMLAMRKEDAVDIVFTHDIHGRILSETVSPTTDNQATRQYEYRFAAAGSAASLTTRDNLNAQYVAHYDGFGRHISTSQIKGTTTQLLIYTRDYDRLGQLTTETQFDYLDTQTLSLTTSYSYDGWGRVSQTSRPDGSIIRSEYDPIRRERIDGIKGSAYQFSVENQYGKTASANLVGSSGNTLPLFTRAFDGFGRRVSETDANGTRTEYGYDGFDRVTSERAFPADGTPTRVLESGYAEHTSEGLKTSLKVGQTVLSTRIFDGVGRVTEHFLGNGQSMGKMSFKYAYVDGASNPVSLRSPDGVTKNYVYDRQLDAVVKININNVAVRQFGFNPRTGDMLSATNIETSREMQVDEYGWPSQEILRTGNQIQQNTYRNSPFGRLQTLTSALNDAQRNNYDAAGRLASADINGTLVQARYDAFSRLSALTTTAAGKSLANEVTYDQFGREAVRRTVLNGTLLQTQTLTYHPTSQIASRRLTGANNAQIIAEDFTYDGYRRLITYNCSGPEYPTDQHGRSIRSQRFTFDALNNITQVVTGFFGVGDDISVRAFLGSDPTQLSLVTHSNPSQTITLKYDDLGQLSSAGVNGYQYDAWGRLTEISAAGTNISRYSYDATGRIIKQSGANNTMNLHYSADKIIGTSQDNSKARYIRHADTVLARSINTIGTELHATDAAESVNTVLAPDNSQKRMHYAPYGTSNIDGTGAGTLLERSQPAFKGEQFDPLGRLYHPGNGLRAYSPELMIFLSPDPLSPFSAGGINSYAYCEGDPINFRDPSGTFKLPLWASWLITGVMVVLSVITLGALAPVSLATLATTLGGITWSLSTTSLALSIAAISLAQVDAINQSDHSRIILGLNIASMAFGITSFNGKLTNVALTTKNTLAGLREAGTKASTLGVFASKLIRFNAAPITKLRGTAITPRYFVQPGFAVMDSISLARTGWSLYKKGDSLAHSSFWDLQDTNSGIDAPDQSFTIKIASVLQSVQEYKNEYQYRTGQLRRSAIRDMYGADESDDAPF